MSRNGGVKDDRAPSKYVQHDSDGLFCLTQDMKGSGYETALLETTLERVGQLLQIGFGAAGAEIIGNNLNSGSGKLNTLNTGSKITAIYGFCDIRQFTDTTECLQEEVMVSRTPHQSRRAYMETGSQIPIC